MRAINLLYEDKGKVVFVADGGVVCRIINTDKEQNPVIEKEQNSD